jgi:hypothetical protein
MRINTDDAIAEAIGLDAADNPEYLRGMCELIARCFPVADVFTDERAKQIKAEILKGEPK